MIRDSLSEGYQSESRTRSRPSYLARDTQQAQETIYRFLLKLVKQCSPEDAFHEFKRLFIHYDTDAENAEAVQALSEIIFSNNEEEFKNTLKRSCYILINNWETNRNYSFIQNLVEIFAEFKIAKKTLSPTLSRLRLWLANFVETKDYQELKLFAAKYEQTHWSHRYTSYLLVPQYVDTKNPVEQREAARVLSQQLKDKFKFELAMYTARSQSALPTQKKPKNPTGLGDDVLRLIKMIVAKRGPFSYTNVASIFLKQIHQLPYREFKRSLQKYLVFSVESKSFVEILQRRLAENLEALYESHDDDILNDALLLRTCNRVIEYLTTENMEEPSGLFVLLLSQGNPLTLVIVLIKLVLISKNSRIHLETCIAKLIDYYKQYPEEDCQWVINFFEVFNITFAIYAENVQYNLIKMRSDVVGDLSSGETLEAYRVFSQLKWKNPVEDEAEAVEAQEKQLF